MKKLRAAPAAACAYLAARASDLLAAAGIACLSVGAALIYPPAGVLVLGILLLAIGIGAER